MGDWECPSDELRNTGWLKIVKGVSYAPEAPACGDRVLDYFVISEDLAQAWAVIATCVLGDAGFGPHSPVRLIVKANTRTVMVRQLRVPIGHGADLPYGPIPNEDALEQCVGTKSTKVTTITTTCGRSKSLEATIMA